MIVSYSSEDLIKEVMEDIECFGENMEVYAVYSWFPDVDKEFITDYVHKDKPSRDETDTDEEYQKLVALYQKSIDSLKETKNEVMTLKKLLLKLKEQDKIL